MSEAFQAQYVSFKYLKGASEYAIELRVPKHKWSPVYETIGDPPDAGESKWVGVALLTGPSE
jgi:hypothetical protein